MRISNVTLCAMILFTGISFASGGVTKHAALKEKSSLTYVLVHPLHRVEGISKGVECEIEYDDATHTVVRTSFEADVMSFNSGNSNRDSHAMEILEALMYPSVSFQSTEIVQHGSDMEVKGNLTFHGRTKPLQFSAAATEAGETLNVTGSAKVSLTAFDIERPSLLMIPSQDTLTISFVMVFPFDH